MKTYHEFLSQKAEIIIPTGMECDTTVCDSAFPFQKDIVNWALRRGRAAVFRRPNSVNLILTWPGSQPGDARTTAD